MIWAFFERQRRRIVFDISVLVAAARSRNGASFKLVSLLPAPEIEIALTIAVYTEWQAVMTRPESLPHPSRRMCHWKWLPFHHRQWQLAHNFSVRRERC